MQMLKNWQPGVCLESDEKQSDYSEGDKTSSSTSPYLNEMCNTKDEGHYQITDGEDIFYTVEMVPWPLSKLRAGYQNLFYIYLKVIIVLIQLFIVIFWQILHKYGQLFLGYAY